MFIVLQKDKLCYLFSIKTREITLKTDKPEDRDRDRDPRHWEEVALFTFLFT